MASTSPQKRGNPFARTNSASPGPTGPPNSNGRPKSMAMPSQLPPTQTSSHNRNQSYSSLAGLASSNSNATSRYRSNSKNGTPTSNTFAPSFIKTDEMRRGPETIKGIEGENDFSGKRYVWLKDPQTAFVKGWIVEDLGNNQILVQCDDGSVCLPVPNPHFHANSRRSKERSMRTAWTRSTPRNLTRQTTWQNLRISMRLPWFITCI
jgi:myosin protein heavy chain